MPETRKEAVRRFADSVGFVTDEESISFGNGFDAGEKFGREAALREAMSVAEKRRIFNACESDKCTTMFMRMRRQSNCEEATEIMYQIKALIPVAEKEEKA